MKKLSKIFLRGLLGLLPLVVTLYLVIVLLRGTDRFFDEALWIPLGLGPGVPGLNLLILLCFITLFGALLGSKTFELLFNMLQGPIRSIPLLKSVYESLHDLTNLLDQSKNSKQGQKVARFEMLGGTVLGLVTNERPEIFSPALKDHVAVFLPLSYALGGHVIFVPREKVTFVDMKVEDLMKLSLTAWIPKSERD